MKILFFDDQRLGGRVNTKRVYGSPVKVGEYTADIACPGLPVIVEDGTIAPYRMYFTAQHILIENGAKKQVNCFCMAVSEDCVHWTPYENDLAFEGKYLPHQLIPSGEIDEVLTLLKDKEGCYRFFACKSDWGNTYEMRVFMYASYDGVHLEKHECNVSPNGAEPFAGSYYNDKKDCYSFIIRPNWAERRCGLVETKDFKTYSPIRVILQVDSMDRAMTEIYGMPTFNMGEYFVGLINLYDAPIWSSRQKFEKGHMSVQLAYSFDGEHYQRSLREPFIPQGTPDCEWYGMMMPYCITEREEDLIITAGISGREHGFFQEDTTAKIISFSLKKDRFVGLESDGGDAIVCSRMMLYHGGDLKINIQVPHGMAKARILDENMREIEGFSFEECIPFTGDTTDWAPQWKNANLETLKDKVFCMEIRFFNGIIYAIEGSFDIFMTFMQIRRYLQMGIKPPKLIY